MANLSCILQCGKRCNEDTDAIVTLERWENIKSRAQMWSGLDKFGEVFRTDDWDKGPSGHCIHDACRIYLYGAKKLEQAQRRHQNQMKE